MLRFKKDDGSRFPDWEECNFGDLYKVHSGFAFKYKSYCESGVALVNGQSIQHGYIENSNMKYLPEAFLQQYKDFVLKENDIVLGLNRPITNGKLKIARIPKEYNNSLLYQRAGKIEYKKAVNDDFSYVLLNREIFKFTVKEAAGSDQPFISTSKLNDWKIKVPCLSEQQKIADFLSTIDTVIEKQKKTVSVWEERKKGVMQKLFSQEVRFKADDGSDFPKWEEKNVEDVCSVSTGKGNTQDKVDTGAYSFYVRSPIIEHSDSYLFDEEAVITVGDGVGTGKVFHYVKGKYNLHQRCYRMYDFREVTGKYFYYFFSTNFYRRVKSMSAKTSVDSVRMEMITKMKILVPCLAEQQKIADCLSSLDEVIEKQKATLAAWEELKKGLLQQMFV